MQQGYSAQYLTNWFILCKANLHFTTAYDCHVKCTCMTWRKYIVGFCTIISMIRWHEKTVGQPQGTISSMVVQKAAQL